ncbi:putative protein OS=Tsukamurella paurometabola (strain ATCC 8368 / DSM / CCUG 35730 /CIP 100753 / JCM 10117 / KCTC 9821 / NBRC 16120 / NCIMB 702349/ NCTC 13040) OX=521096 GN=Tpau_3903 PE=4 SV=1 [Tsukamurella paurometabola]|uniref:Uncharacterized protein n=1 Tax=Tsukamurella paurometabola (strain ATCC 8368 / DSM 20162 / CCUG 35730 / CIP 100753 / JCM 10117 / KCTC 9821 / NBRC 16120 / NCIMB 702349 / NCTC 13040) TaxID=521096 RepID=D5UMK1_TSUPD|nr:hypothetical protein [Tsukamurella paurometabola]ADG80475.1 hypothetical protein Tpau_3903 [Tsukamurella paurometabola DSM 20162]SUP39784.1 Uncharacterised protein [Tsukamurella paurometabola]
MTDQLEELIRQAAKKHAARAPRFTPEQLADLATLLVPERQDDYALVG